MKNDGLEEKFLKDLLTLENFTVDLIREFFFLFQLVSILGKLVSKFKRFFTGELKIP